MGLLQGRKVPQSHSDDICPNPFGITFTQTGISPTRNLARYVGAFVHHPVFGIKSPATSYFFASNVRHNVISQRILVLPIGQGSKAKEVGEGGEGDNYLSILACAWVNIIISTPAYDTKAEGGWHAGVRT